MALTDNLISCWELTEASGSALDSHGSNDLTDNNTVGAGTGKIIGARDFESDNSEYFSLADNASLSCGDIDFTLACWINFERLASGTYMAIAAKGDLFADEYGLFQSDPAGKKFTFRVKQNDLNSTGAPSTGTWYHVVGWHDSVNNLLGISVNDSANTTSYSSGCTDSTGDFRIGASTVFDGSPTLFMDGLIEQVAFWKRVLTSGERTQLYNAGAGLAYSSWAGGGGGGTATNLLLLGVG